ncbi:restless-like transposase [Hirsutella rhossiliensis]|uniref:Restless-like transposase n=1 Tax=Hirsutella rhossiliensis TaxID=111463 RepID=A0A9P8N901_9HYPO|nr:restless-like transposase [Hirsutella rhossiliensis]KAH0968919.1 restless-like transposase [Hirsutella rhossiliensis]
MDKNPSKNIVEMLNLNASDPKEQGIANALIQRFDKDHFQRLLLEWVVDANVSFRQPEHCRLRHIFEYLNPSVADGVPSKLVLGMPELKISHSGENIAAQILEILESYEILDKVGYITLDNAGNMDTATEEIAEALGFDPKKRRVRCFGHVLNLVVKALLFGHKSDAFEAKINGEPVLDAVQHEIWRKKGPVTLEFRKKCRNGMRRAKEMPLCLREESLLSDNDWKVIELMDRVLVDFEEALRMLEGDAQSRVRKGGRIEAYGNMWDVASTYEFLMDRLEEWKAVAEKFPDPEHLKANINLGWDKLNDYYTKLDETPAYYASAILNPVSRGKRMVRKLWEEEYKSLPIPSMPDEEQDFVAAKRIFLFGKFTESGP